MLEFGAERMDQQPPVRVTQDNLWTRRQSTHQLDRNTWQRSQELGLDIVRVMHEFILSQDTQTAPVSSLPSPVSLSHIVVYPHNSGVIPTSPRGNLT